MKNRRGKRIPTDSPGETIWFAMSFFFILGMFIWWIAG